MQIDTERKIETYQQIEEYFSSDQHSYVNTEIDSGVALVTLNDPERLNCLSGSLTIQLRTTIERLNQDPSIRAVVLTGQGPAFSAGGDMELMGMAHEALHSNASEGATIMRNWIRLQFGGVARGIRNSEKIYITAINGAAAGVGLAFAFASDMILASDKARIVLAFSKIGLVPEVGSNWHLTRMLGYQKAMELFLDGGEINATKALDMGLVNRVVDHDHLLSTAKDMARKTLEYPPHLLSMTKSLMHRANDVDWASAIEMEEYAEALCFTTAFHQQRVAAFGKGR